jgi:hypothetical protein
MNDFTKEIVLAILGEEWAWDKKTHNLNFDLVQSNYQSFLQAWFEQNILPQVYNHSTALWIMFTKQEDRRKHFTWVPDLWCRLPERTTEETDPEWLRISGIEGNPKAIYGGWTICQCSDECFIEEKSEYLQQVISERLEKLWNGGQYEFYLNEEEVLGLDIKPLLVYDKVDKRGNIQLGLNLNA